MAILEIVVTLLVIIALLTYLLKKWIETAWSSNKLKAIIAGFLFGAIVGVIVYFLERLWLKMHVEKPFNLMLFYFLPHRQFKVARRKVMSMVTGFKKNKSAKAKFSIL